MFTYGVSLSWMILSPFAFITDILAIIIITHYVPFLHGTDVTVLSALAAMAGNAMLVLPIPAVLGIRKMSWTQDLCTGYVWCFLTFKVSQTLSLCVMCVHWSVVLKMSAAKKTYVTTKFLKISIVFVWIFSAIFGILPLIGAADDDFNESSTCKFLGFNLGTGFSLFFIIFNITVILVSLICAIDATVLIKNMKIVAKAKYQTGRFHIPDKRADLPNHGPSNVIDRYHRLTFAWDLSKFVLILATLVSFTDILPYAIIQGIQLFNHVDRDTLEVISLYLIGFEALILPHTLWLVSKRYRHAIVYQFKVYILRRKDAEEDPCSCILQSYTPRDKDRVSLGPSRPPSSLSRAGGYSASGTLRSTKSVITSNDNLHIHTNGRSQITTISGDRIDIRHMNGVVKSEVQVETHGHPYNERGIDAEELEMKLAARSPGIEPNGHDPMRKISEASSSTYSDPSSGKGKVNSTRYDVKRSSSGVSRKDWKDQMRKKNLPPIFINEGFDSEDQKSRNMTKTSLTAPNLSKAGHQSQTSLHYYMSSDYHPDYLTDSLPRHKIASRSFESESDGVSGYYNDDDIGDVLDDQQLGNVDHGRYNDGTDYSDAGEYSNRRPYLSTFKSPVSFEREDSVTKPKPSAKGVYSTFEDLTASSDLRGENEMMFDIDTIPIDKVKDGYNSLKGIKRKPNSTGGYDWRSRPKYSMDFQDDIYRARLDSVVSPRFMMFDKYDAKSNPFHTIQGVQMATTSFGRTGSFDSRPKKSERLANTDEERMLSSTKVSDYLQKNYVFGANTGDDGTFDNSTRTLVLNDRKAGTYETSTDTVPIASLQDDENVSSGSNSSVTLSPYKGEVRRRPWMDDYDITTENNRQMVEPLVEESDSETLRDSRDYNEWRNGSYLDNKHSHSELSTPVSSIFDEETDRGFEEALDIHVNASGSVYGGVGLCFESIKEEPEDLGSSGSNPFLDNGSNGEEEFKTQAVVSKSSRSNSRTSSCTSVSDNPFASSPKQHYENGNPHRMKNPIIVTTDIEFELGDSGFTSGLEKGNHSDSSGHHDPSGGKLSPWPDEDGHQHSAVADNSFESDFNTNPFEDMSSFSSKKSIAEKYKISNVSENSPYASLGRSRETASPEAKKPMNKSVMDIKSNNKQAPVRVKSLDNPSPLTSRNPPKRGISFEGLQTDIKPVYF